MPKAARSIPQLQKVRQPRESHNPYNRTKKTGPKPKNAPRTAAQPKKTAYVVLTNADWLTVFRWIDLHPEATQEEVVRHFSSKKEGAPHFSQTTLSRRLAKRTQIEDRVAEYSGGASAKRERIVTAPQVDRSLFLWLKEMEAKNETVSGKMLIEKRKIFEERLGIPQAQRLEGPGWLASFCRAYGVKEIRRHGEAASVDLEAVEEEIKRLRKVTASYARKDILILDESGLFAFAPPDRGLATRQMSGKKKSKFRITLTFMTNADGSEKWKLMFIGKYKNPRCFKAHTQRLKRIYYRNNKKAWMTAVLFEEYIKSLDLEMRVQNRHVLLLVDNFSGHYINYEPRNVRIEFFKPNMTSLLQPLDAGPIRTFKAKYRAALCQRALLLDDAGESDIFALNLFEAILLAEEAWDQVTPETIKHCWDHTRILSDNCDVVGTDANSDVRQSPEAWAILREFAVSNSMTLPDAENKLKDVLGVRFNASDWKPALDAVLNAENDPIAASEALPPRAPQTLSAEEELMGTVGELRKRNRVFGVPLSIDELVDPVEERVELMESEQDFGAVKDLDGAIIDQVAYETAVSNGEIVEIESDEEEEEDEEAGTTKADLIALCARMEKLVLKFGADIEYDGILGLANDLRRFRGRVNRERLLTAKQVSLDQFFTSSSAAK
ncbi:hypothetical protein NMY22_g14859 [Coprinellus aureogranulatus]|nr:hypothetical protein NMY22_g14859 [Coprinellus aureogranulatus]